MTSGIEALVALGSLIGFGAGWIVTAISASAAQGDTTEQHDYIGPGVLGFFWPLTLWPILAWLICVSLANRRSAVANDRELAMAERRVNLAVFEREMGITP